MFERRTTNKYVIISPVKDEVRYIETTINAVLRQTKKPDQWIIVDDGSRDGTAMSIERYAAKVSRIQVLKIDRNTRRQPGSGVIQAFLAGYRLVRDADFDFIVKLDCDLDLPPDYFEHLMEKFSEDGKLGIASGVYLEAKRGRWLPVEMPDYHAAGASKMVRASCFREIGGFVPVRGWDTIDEIKAQNLGWKTTHFKELQFYHLKNEGSGVGLLRTNLMLGETYYLTGGGKLFFLLKVLHRTLLGKPFFLGGLLMLGGYLRPWVSRRRMLVSDAESKFYRKLLNKRIIEWLTKKMACGREKRRAWNHS